MEILLRCGPAGSARQRQANFVHTCIRLNLLVTLCLCQTVLIPTVRGHTEANDVTPYFLLCNFTSSPVMMETVKEHTSRTLVFNLTCDWSVTGGLTNVTVQIWVDNPKFVSIEDNQHYNLSRNHDSTLTSNLTLTGLEFGRTDVVFEVCEAREVRSTSLPDSWSPAPGSGFSPAVDPRVHGVPDIPGPCYRILYNIAVVPSNSVLGQVFKIVLGVMVVLFNLAFGCAIRPAHVLEILKRPVGPAIGMCCQFILMAPVSFGIAKMLRMDVVSGLGLFTVGSAPGGGGSNIFAYLLDGDLELSITMSFMSTILSLGMTPLWIWTLGRYFADGGTRTVIPVKNVFTSLAVATVPVILGATIAHFKPKAAKKIVWCLKPFTAVIGVVFITLGVYVNLPGLLRVDWRTLVAVILMPFFGYSVGASMARGFRQSRSKIIAISLEIGFQSFSLSMMILTSSLESPEAEIACVVPLSYTFLSAAMPSLAFYIKQIIRLHNWRMRQTAHAGLEDFKEHPDVTDGDHMNTIVEGKAGSELVLNGIAVHYGSKTSVPNETMSST